VIVIIIIIENFTLIFYFKFYLLIALAFYE